MVDRRHVPDDPARELRALLRHGRFHDVVEAYRRAAPTGERQPPEMRLLAATAATRLGDLETGTVLAEEALEGFRVRADDDGRMRATNLLGAISFERGRLDEAERRYGEALRLAQQLDDNLMVARISNNLGTVAHLRGDVPGALSLYRTALLNYQRLGDRHFIAETYHNLGIAFRLEEEWRLARNAATEAVHHAEVVGEPSLMALVVSGRAEIDLDRGELELSAQGIARAAQLTADAGDAVGQADVCRLRAVLALRRGDYGTARQEAESAYETAARAGSTLLAAESAATLALALQRLGRQMEADEWRRQAVTGFRALGAGGLLARFEREWEEVKQETA